MQNQLLLGNVLQVLVEDRIISSPMSVVTMSSSSFRWKKYERDRPEKIGTKAAMGLEQEKVPKRAGRSAFGYPPKSLFSKVQIKEGDA